MGETSVETAPRAVPEPAASTMDGPRPGETAVAWTLCLTYGAFYFCRTNISTIVSNLKASVSSGGLGLAGAEVGWILAGGKIAYGLGQLLNGQLSERIRPRVLLAIGMFGSAALNVLFGLSTGFYFLLFVWAANGLAQSLGWTPCVRVAANWIPIERRGNAMGIIGAGYQITQGLTYLIASQAAQHLGWRWALYAPAVLLTAAGLFMLLFLREAPEDRSEHRHNAARPTRPATCSLSDGLYWTLYNPTLWLLGLSLGLLNACRYGFVDWGIAHLMETRDIGVGKAGLNYFVIAIGATAGAYLTGWATDRFFGGRRAPMICMLMALLGVLTLFYDNVVKTSVPGTLLLLVVIGFCIYGPQVLLVGTAPADLAHKGTSAAAAGFVNFMGYMGAASGDIITGYFSSPEHGGWQTAIYIWAGWAFAGAVITAGLWNTTSRRVGLLPSLVPKLGVVAALAGASAALSAGGVPPWLRAASYAATACAFVAALNRWAALPCLAVAAIGLLTILFSHLATRGEITWQQATAVLAYGLAAIMALMILVEKKEERCES